MALDPTIPLQVLNPAQVQQQTQQTQLNNLKLQQGQQDIQLGQQNLQKGQIGLQSDQIQQAMQKNENVIQLLQGVTDQPSYDRAKQSAQSMGLPIDHLPPNYDQNTINQLTQSALSVKDRLQIQAMQGYRQAMIGLKAANTFGSVQAAAAAGYGPSADGSGMWQPLAPVQQPAQPASTPMLGGGNTGAMSAPAQPSGITNTAATIPAMQQSAATNPPPLPAGMPNANLSPTQIAAMPTTGAQQIPPTATQIANTPTAQNFSPQPGETMASARLRMQNQGGVIGINQAKILQQNPGMNPTTAFLIAKNGLKTGQTVDASGKVVNMDGSVDAQATQAYQVEAAKTAGEASQAGNLELNKEAGKTTITESDKLNADASQSQNMLYTLSTMKQALQQFNAGAFAPAQQSMLRMARALNLPISQDQVNNLNNEQVFTKLSNDIIGAAAKAEGGASRLQAAFQTIKEANPNIGLEPETLNVLIDKMGAQSNKVIQQQQAWAGREDKSQTFNDFQTKYISDLSKQQQGAGGQLPQYNFGAPPAPSGQAPQATKILNGIAYHNINGQWMQ